MWLPKDEGKLLQGYYFTIGEVGRQHSSSTEDLLDLIKSTASVHLPPAGDPQYVKKFKAWLHDSNRIEVANKNLKERGFIVSSDNLDSAPITISLTITGYDLGRKYDSLFERNYLFFKEYKDHWCWLILGFLGGIIGALIVNWLLK